LRWVFSWEATMHKIAIVILPALRNPWTARMADSYRQAAEGAVGAILCDSPVTISLTSKDGPQGKLFD
jgi:hypothetical protein